MLIAAMVIWLFALAAVAGVCLAVAARDREMRAALAEARDPES